MMNGNVWRRILCAACCVLLLSSLFGCGEKSFASADFPEEMKQYLSPWDMDAAALAKKEGKIHYYFMTSKGLIMDETELFPYKWGDACLIVLPDGQTMLVDSGMEAYGPILVENLKRLGIKKLDSLVLTHPHSDHCYGALKEGGVLDNFAVGKVYWNGVQNTNWKEINLPDRCAEKGIPTQILQRGDVLELGQVRFEILGPSADTKTLVTNETEALNNSSIVMRLEYKEHTALFTGDLFVSGEEELMAAVPAEKLDVDFMKACHHGQSNSNSAAFVQATSPELAVATGFHSVEEAIVNRYEYEGCKFLFDQYNGYIHVETDGYEIAYDTLQTRAKDNK